MISVRAWSQGKLIRWVAYFPQYALSIYVLLKARSVNTMRTKRIQRYWWYPPDLCLQHLWIITSFVRGAVMNTNLGWQSNHDQTSFGWCSSTRLYLARTIVCGVFLISEKAHWIWEILGIVVCRSLQIIHMVTFRGRIRGRTVSLKSQLCFLKAILRLILNVSKSKRRKQGLIPTVVSEERWQQSSL